ncbi:MAG TPA: hypothetical protein VGB65_01740 [Allosphingosinicella sp.]
MRLPLSCALAALLLAPAYGSAQAPKTAAARPAKGAWVTEVGMYRLNEDDPRTEGTYYKGVGTSWSYAWQQWITPEDVPAEYRARSFKNLSRVVLDVDTAGKPGNCRPIGTSPEPRLDALACALLMKRARFDIRYAGPGRPVPYRFATSVTWCTSAAAGAGSPPPRIYTSPPAAPLPGGPGPLPPQRSQESSSGWPRLNWSKELVVGPAPAIQAAWPGGAEGRVSLDLALSPEKGATDCKIGVSSGVAALDDAACQVARTVPVLYKEMCETLCREHSIPLQIVWKRAGSHVRLPLEPSAPTYVGTRRLPAGTITRKDLAKLPDLSVKRREIAPLVWVDADGRPTKCISAAYSSGNRALDARLCELLLKKMRYSRRTDVFGDPAPDLFYDRIDLDGLL